MKLYAMTLLLALAGTGCAILDKPEPGTAAWWAERSAWHTAPGR